MSAEDGREGARSWLGLSPLLLHQDRALFGHEVPLSRMDLLLEQEDCVHRSRELWENRTVSPVSPSPLRVDV